MYAKLLILVGFLLFIGCSGDNNKQSSKTTEVSTTQEYKNSVPLKSVPKEKMQFLFENADATDYIFHHHPFSMSQDDVNSVRSNLQYISSEPNPYIPKNCSPIARQFFQAQGEIVCELDVYFDNNCAFYVFVENEKPVYSNLMTDVGKNFFNSTMAQASKAR
jgi:hypothetical protein